MYSLALHTNIQLCTWRGRSLVQGRESAIIMYPSMFTLPGTMSKLGGTWGYDTFPAMPPPLGGASNSPPTPYLAPIMRGGDYHNGIGH